MLHALGAQTATQVLLISALGTNSHTSATLMLTAFIAGLMLSNLLTAIAASLSFNLLQKSAPVFVFFTSLAAVFSLLIGLLFVLGKVQILPALT